MDEMSRRPLAAYTTNIVGRRGRNLSLIAAIVALSVSIAACGDSDDSTTSADSSSSTKGSAGLLCYTSLVNVGQVPDFTASYKEIAQDLGLQYKELIASPQGDLNSSISNLKTCIANKAKIIVSTTQENSAVRQQIKAAKAAGIYYISDYSGDPVTGVDGLIAPNNAKMVEQMVAWLKENLDSDQPDVLALTASSLAVPRTRVDDFVKAVKPLGWNVTVKEMDVADPSGSAERLTSAALLGNPDLKVVFTPWDDPAAGANAALRGAGNKDVTLVTFEGLPATYEAMRSGASLVAAVNATPTALQVDLRRIIVGQMVKGTFKAPYYAYAWGYNVTPDNLPSPDQMESPSTRIVGGKAVINDKEYTAKQISAMADKISP